MADKQIDYADKVDFVRSLPLVMDKAARLGLYKTMHALHEAVRQSGYELAEQHFDKGKFKP